MRVLITAGGTSEKIDDVRSITNHSTGSLGVALSDYFFQQGVEVYYVTTKTAKQPTHFTKKFFIHSTLELKETLTDLLKTVPFDGVIHSMAVSDFSFSNALSEESFKQLQNPKEELFSITSKKETKISSDTEHLILVLKKNPKIISLIKTLQPKTHLIGFKLLVDVKKEELIAVAQKSLKKNNADFIVANDLLEVDTKKHHAYLVGETGVKQEAFTKIEIAKMIYDALKEEEK